VSYVVMVTVSLIPVLECWYNWNGSMLQGSTYRCGAGKHLTSICVPP